MAELETTPSAAMSTPDNLQVSEDRTATPKDLAAAKLIAPNLRLAITYIVGGLIGILASFELSVEYIKGLQEQIAGKSFIPNCDFNITVQCSANMASWQGSLFGFPNALIGLVCFAMPVCVGVSIIAKARMPKWYWVLYNIGMLGGYVFITWLFSQSIYVIGTLCPWCMVTWFVTIIIFWYCLTWNLKSGVFGSSLKRFGEIIFSWTWVIILLNDILIAVLAQLRLDWIQYL